MVHLAKLKRLNRHLFLSVDEQRKVLDTNKIEIEKLQLSYENLLYKKAYLHREIRQCKDINTPNLDQIEKERNEDIATQVYHSNMEEVHQKALAILQHEKEARKEVEGQYKDLQEHHSRQLEKLDRKRKFLDEFPKKIAIIRASITDLSKEFQEIAPHEDDETIDNAKTEDSASIVNSTMEI